eukprot:gene4411-7786_t
MTSVEQKTKQLPTFDLSSFLIGKWKRNLTCKEFGGLFQHQKGTSSIIQIEQMSTVETKDLKSLRWYSGKSLKEKNFLFQMKILPKKDETEIFSEIEVNFDNHICDGRFYEKEKSFILNFSTSESVSNLTYKIVDQDSMSICSVDISSSGNTIQFGNFIRIKDTNYVV